MRDGFTLLEIVVTIVLVTILTGLTAPALVAATDRGAIRMGLAQLRGAHEEARLAAVLDDRRSVLTVDSMALTLWTMRGPDTVLKWRRSGPAAWGVHLVGGRKSFVFSPVGYSIGVSNATLRIERGSASGRLIISRLGRVRVEMQ
ncbi:MAG TPA: prepilin-type N-terminal cleavage/methylation domain-containing protein [Gemmatimonadales bacterium]|nr:prepilin-type N-terminal cleavage/methylation domain-containing protein [Gemmatimonadales bacterium]